MPVLLVLTMSDKVGTYYQQNQRVWQLKIKQSKTWILAGFGISTELLIFRRHAITVVFYKGEWKEWQ